MDLERIPIENYLKNIKRYYAFIVKQGLSDAEFFNTIRTKNANIEKIDDGKTIQQNEQIKFAEMSI